MAQTRKSVYDQTVRITDEYLGPAAGRFIDRQVRNHLHKKPENITAKDLKRLTSWIRLAVILLTDDIHIVEDYIGQLERLASESRSEEALNS